MISQESRNIPEVGNQWYSGQEDFTRKTGKLARICLMDRYTFEALKFYFANPGHINYVTTISQSDTDTMIQGIAIYLTPQQGMFFGVRP